MWLLIAVINLLLAIAVARLWKERAVARTRPGVDRETLQALRSYQEEIRGLVDDAEERLSRRCSELEACILRADRLRREMEARQEKAEETTISVAPSGASRIQYLFHQGRSPAEIARQVGCSLREVNLALSFQRGEAEERSRIGVLD